ncbi:phage tail tape measure protein [Allopontixanthobacter sp.]|uniref:phage tail tape measure protein n=1 Tax=Allopontixanthobacter sp. TaxID=2906452 RepID=UPI002ABC23E1|nr:phage tail tape measure protein [Allopontixanthobacter sp.]MDZ4307170.1 phage tail tape measure protein [Allopontixanthobacter sp.]
MATLLAGLLVKLGLDTAEYQNGVRRANKETTAMQRNMASARKAVQQVGAALGGMALLAVANKIKDMSRAAIDAAGNLGEEAKALGVTTTALQEFRFAATQVNIEQTQVDDALAQLTRRLGDAAQGVKEPLKALEKLGIAVRNSKGEVIGAGEAMPLIAEGLKKVGSDAERAAITVDLFGRSGQKLAALLGEGAAGVDRLTGAAHKLGIILSESDIAKADEVADKLAALNFQITAQQNKKLLENADALLTYEQSVGDLKLTLIDASSRMQTWVDEFDRFNAEGAAQARENWRAVPKFFEQVIEQIGVAVGRIPEIMASAVRSTVNWTQQMYQGVKTWIVDRLNGVWNTVTEKVEMVRNAFFDLWDKVTRRSYIPDMVDDIAQQMGRLDSVMVDVANRTTAGTKEAFRAMAQEVRGLLADLFPEAEQMRGYRDMLNLIDRAEKAGAAGGGLDGSTADEARRRALATLRSDGGIGAALPVRALAGGDSPLVTADQIAKGIAKVEKALGLAADKTKAQTVRIAKSFADMAQDTIGSLQRLTSSIKGGGFLDILGAALGLFTQLGSVGLLGKSIQTNLAKVPGYANGTSFHPGGMAIVGERGPELLNLPRGSQVGSNDNLKSMMSGGRGELAIRLGPGLEAEWLQKSAGQTVQIFQAAAPGMMNAASSRTRRDAARPVTPGGSIG